MPVIIVDALLTHPDVGMGGVDGDPAELAPLTNAVADSGLGKVLAVVLWMRKTERQLILASVYAVDR